MLRIFNQYVSLKTILLVVVEAGLFASSLWLAARIRFWDDPGALDIVTAMPEFALEMGALVLTFQILFYYNDLYNLHAVRRRTDQVLRIGESLGAGSLLLGLIFYVFPPIMIGRGIFLIALAFSAVSAVLVRVGLDAVWSATGARQRVVIMGSGNLALALAREFTQREDLHIKLVGFVTKNSPEYTRLDSVFGHPVLGTTDKIEQIVGQNNVSRIVVALEDYRGALSVRDLVRLRVHGVQIQDAHTVLAALTGKVWLESVRPSWFVFSEGFNRGKLTLILKRLSDIAISLVGVIAGAPVFAAVALAIRLDSAGPLVYRQRRVGYRGRVFDVLKFRSMHKDAEKMSGPQWASEDDPRITRVGKILRKYRFDELPQFFNVLRGEMSFVGPRPERPMFVKMLSEKIPFYDERHSVRPGITGWAQVSYEYGASVEDALRKLEYDLFYIKNLSFLFDIVIVLKTVRIVVFGRGR